MEILKELIEITDNNRAFQNEPMSKHTTFRVGGNADYYVSVKNEEEAVSVVRLLLANRIKYYFIGNGSNLLVSDDGFRGCIIEIGKDYSSVSINGNIITAEAGALIVKVARDAYNNSLTGLEFASGIPGTVGGAVCMDAGAYGGEIKDVVKSVRLFNPETGEIFEKTVDEMNFSYRHSICKEKPYIVLSATFELKEGNKDDIKEVMDELREKRTTKQPLEYPSAGSTFKRPVGYFAGKLIEDAGLKGYTVGGAQVSEKHSGFVINKGDATASDVMTLINNVRDIVNEKFDVVLEPEVCMIGEF